MPSVEQRKYMYHRVREIRVSQPIFAMDFQNDGEYVGGCVAGGRRYLHINAAGDIEPCVFIHYSDANIRKTSLLEALQMPLFKAYHAGQPFNENHLRPCPMLENPEKLRAMIDSTVRTRQICNRRKAQSIYVRNASNTPLIGRRRRKNCGEESPRGQKAKLEKEKSCKVGGIIKRWQTKKCLPSFYYEIDLKIIFGLSSDISLKSSNIGLRYACISLSRVEIPQILTRASSELKNKSFKQSHKASQLAP